MAGQSSLALPVSFLSKITNSKHQITNKSQIPIFNDQNLSGQNLVWNFGHCYLFVFWDLIFVIFKLPIKQLPYGDEQSLVSWPRVLCFLCQFSCQIRIFVKPIELLNGPLMALCSEALVK